MKDITVLSFGGGQDSTALLLMAIYDEAFRHMYVDHCHFVVVFSDTGNEHPHTYKHIERMKDLCVRHAIEFVHLTPRCGFHTQGWQSLVGWMERTGNIIMMNQASCTSNLKIRPIYKWLDEWIGKRFGIPYGHKKAIKAYARKQRINVLVGIAKGEERRMRTHEQLVKANGKWFENINVTYPLIHWGMDRSGCQERIANYDVDVPYPSNCMMCPYQSKQELLWLHRNHPGTLNKWMELERQKFQKFKGSAKNYGPFLNKYKSISHMLAQALKEFGHWSDDQLNQYKMNHGCEGKKHL